MPIYEYESPSGSTVLERRPVAERDAPLIVDGVPHRRRTLPSRLTVGTGAAPETMSAKTWKGYRDLELKGQLQDRPGYMPVAEVKKVLAAPETD